MSAATTMRAFADCWDGWERGSEVRNLNYRDVDWTNLKEWARTMGEAVPNGYNEFDATRVAEGLRPFEDAIECRAARESSVALYIRDRKGGRMAIEKIRRLAPEILCADEVDDANESTWPTLRLWWD